MIKVSANLLGKITWSKQAAHVVAAQLLFMVKLRVQLVDTGPEVGRVTAESDVQVLQECVAASEKRLGFVGMGIDTGLAIEDNDPVSKICCHDEIVLDNEGGLLGVHNEALDDTAGHDTLLRVQIYTCVSKLCHKNQVAHS